MAVNLRGEAKDQRWMREENACACLRRTAMNRHCKTAQGASALILATSLFGANT
ncbi:MAG: hypothetical protein AVDCRST_MAG15-2343 [uncultured Rubellimicrobium sp.]|uniref:Uncharacterized protein n=1 Tax=uncultured Rubellimicrobium sp. TaxID=543078 RepID=A0A6J4PT38_9RHOB|nr:MAG: hypothetical protein AVDCRST_MAG15-2343 [uncultured Rubellimicrobium sp.]